MLRTVTFALIAANLLFFVWARGWLAPVLQPPHHGEREPERLALQVRPETIRLAPAGSAPGATLACLEAGPLSDADVGVAEAALLGAGVPAGGWTRQQQQLPAQWLVYMGRFADPAALRSKVDELRRIGVTGEEVSQPPDLAPGLALSRHPTQEAADEALTQLTQTRAVRTARVVALPPPPLQHWLRMERADAVMRARVAGLKPPVIAASFGPCRPR